jgi:hypothetical protein
MARHRCHLDHGVKYGGDAACEDDVVAGGTAIGVERKILTVRSL